MASSTIVFFLIGTNTLFAAAILWSTLTALSTMTRKCNFWPRVAYVLMGTGAFAAILAPFYLERVPTLPELMFMVALTILRLSGNILPRQRIPQAVSLNLSCEARSKR